MKCEATTMENGFQVTILDSQALESWYLDWILKRTSALPYNILSTETAVVFIITNIILQLQTPHTAFFL